MILYIFTKNNCAPCARLKPVLTTLAADVQALGISAHSINIDEQDATALLLQYGVRSVPTVVLTDDAGTLLDQFPGGTITHHAVMRSIAIEQIAKEVKEPNE